MSDTPNHSTGETLTPLTDAIKEAYGNAPDPCVKSFMHSYANLARSLEKQLAAAKRREAALREALQAILDDYNFTNPSGEGVDRTRAYADTARDALNPNESERKTS